MASLGERGALVIVAPPGSGKTTRLPVALLESGALGDGLLLLLQPRRVAARAAARRIAEELGEPVGRRAGFVVRDESARSRETRILVVTEGIVTRMLLDDPSLPGVSAVMLDELHERSVHTDLALAMLREVKETLREDLLLIAASATLDAGPVSRFLFDAPVLTVDGRLHPVEVRNLGPVSVARGIAHAVEDPSAPAGDVLVFLPGGREIRQAAEETASLAVRHRLIVRRLHGDLPASEQDAALRPDAEGRRKVTLSTNLAETSLTIEGVTAVVDSGQARVLRFDPRSGLDRLVLSRISRASADQRAGRAGRLGPGVAYRLWAREEDRGLAPFDEPELLRTDLAGPLLSMLLWAPRPLDAIGWFEAPPEPILTRALALLRRLGAVEREGTRTTPLGRRLGALPLHPRLAAVAMAAEAKGFPRAGALVAALLEERDVLASARAFGGSATVRPTSRSDVLDRLDLVSQAERGADPRALGLDAGALRAVRAGRDRIARGLSPASRGEPQEETLLRLLLAGFPDRVARRVGAGDQLVMVGGRRLQVDRGSAVRDAAFVVVLDTAGGDTAPERATLLSEVDVAWLAARPEYVEETGRSFDAARGLVTAERRARYDDLVLSEQPVPAPLDEGTATLLRDAARRDLSAALGWGEEERRLAARLAFLRDAMPELELPALDRGALDAILVERLPGKRRLDELSTPGVAATFRERLPYAARRALDLEAPESLAVPSGREIPLVYEEGQPPVLAVKLQELFGLAETPRIAGGRVPVLLHLLSPAGRPVQVTRDLTSFWNATYPDVRKELRGRYPKHPWPDDPWTAPARRGTTRSGR